MLLVSSLFSPSIYLLSTHVCKMEIHLFNSILLKNVSFYPVGCVGSRGSMDGNFVSLNKILVCANYALAVGSRLSHLATTVLVSYKNSYWSWRICHMILEAIMSGFGDLICQCCYYSFAGSSSQWFGGRDACEEQGARIWEGSLLVSCIRICPILTLGLYFFCNIL